MGTRSAVAGRRTMVHLGLVLAVLVAYVAVLAYQGPKGKERFPVFKWELFSKVPAPTNTSYGIRVVQVQGKAVSPPRYYEDAQGLVPFPHSPDARQLTQQFGSAVDHGWTDRAEAKRKLFEARFFGGVHGVRYEVVKRRFDILHRFECGCYEAQDVLGTFTYA